MEKNQDANRESVLPDAGRSNPAPWKEVRGPMDPDRIYDAGILIVDDHEETVITIEYALRKGGYRSVHHTLDSRETFSMFPKIRPDLLILGLFMPSPDGIGILDQLALQATPDPYLPVLVAAGEVAAAAKIKALSKGARGILRKPVDPVELLTQVRNLIEWRFLACDLKTEKKRWRLAPMHLEKGVEDGAGLTGEAFNQLRRIGDCLDPGRTGQAEKTAEISHAIGARIGLAQESLRYLRLAARVYDFGMLAVPEAIRRSEQILKPEELKALQRHTVAGEEMFRGSRIPGMELLHEVAAGHHERWDGTGYPRGLKGSEIPLSARIVAVAQYYVALISSRPYRPAFTTPAALEEVSRQRGYAFDPEVVDALLETIGASTPQDELVKAG